MEISGSSRRGLLPRKGEQLPGQAHRTLRGMQDLDDVLPPWIARGERVPDERCVWQDHREDVVEVVRHTSSQLADGVHLPRLNQRLV